ncbi:hypothetical protein QOZ80_6BG0470640 [Eleusine coracana subsp. coracana]|nr:hypothetical protein QOZ80_6BG0470640 [Eleusine coracana subsp. coracana]
MMKTAVRNWRYKLNKLKQDHFDPFPLHLVTKTSPVKSTSDAQRMELVEMWKTPKKMEVCQKNKDNLGKVKFHQKTGSCSYPVFVENLEDKDQEKDKEPDALKLFKACHYNKKTKGFTPAVQSVIHNQQKTAPPPRLSARDAATQLEAEKVENGELRKIISNQSKQMDEMSKKQAELEAKLELLLGRN